jgi:hypothetical protein
LHPFDIKTVVFAKHAQHVVLIHFPIAMFIIGVLFDFLAQWKRQRLLAAAAYYNLLVAAIATLPVVVTGILAWQWELEGQKLKGITAQTVNENEAVIEAAGGVRRLAIKVLEQKPSGIYVCVVKPGENGSQAKTQSVILLKRKDSNALLKGRESFREFAACRVIGGSDSSSNSY